MNLYIGKPKKSTKNLLKSKVKFSRVVGYKINNIEVIFLYTYEQSKNEIKKQFHL